MSRFNKDHNVFGSILGAPYSWKKPPYGILCRDDIASPETQDTCPSGLPEILTVAQVGFGPATVGHSKHFK